MPFGMKNSPGTFQRLVNKVISGLDGVVVYIDDVIIYSDTWEEHLRLIRTFFDRLSEFQLTVNLNKSELCHGTLTFLGHVVEQGQVKPIFAKIQAINNFPIPSSKKQLIRFFFFGMAGYNRKFCNNFFSTSAPLTDLLKKNCKFVWNETCQIHLKTLRPCLVMHQCFWLQILMNCLNLLLMLVMLVQGECFYKKMKMLFDHLVCYFSHKFNKHRKVYSTIEKECLALILSLHFF